MTTYRLKNLDCPNCAAKVEDAVRKAPGVKSASVDFGTLSMRVDAADLGEVERAARDVEPELELDVVVGAPSAATRLEEEREAPVGEIVRIALATLVFVPGLVFLDALRAGPFPWAAPALFAVAYLIAGVDVVWAAVRGLFKGRFFDELFLMAIASAGAFVIGEYEEAVGVMLFFKVGELLQDYAVGRSRGAIRSLLALRPDSARVKRDGAWSVVAPEDVKVGELVLVRPGERVPVDGVVSSGTGSMDGSALTGESAPKPCGAGDEVRSGYIAADASFEIECRTPAAESSAARIAGLVEGASHAKAKTERLITRFARWYTPAVVFAALAVALLPPIFVPGETFKVWSYRALVMLVISCPCAFVVSVPLGYFGGLGGAARRGILVRGGEVLDALADASVVVFDKTGTLTDGRFAVTSIVAENGFTETDVLRLAAAAEARSNHPAAVAVRRAWNERRGAALPATIDLKEIAGHGVHARLDDGTDVVAGHDRILHLKDIAHGVCETEGTVIHVAANGLYAGRLLIADEAKPDAEATVAALGRLGVGRVAMLTGDGRLAANSVASSAGIGEVHANLLPHEKLQRLEAIIADEDAAAVSARRLPFSRRGRRGSVIFVGDGINDAPVLARADAGIAMGGSGSDLAVETADAVIVTDEPSRVAEAIVRARRTRAIIVQNIVGALGVKLFFLTLGAFGIATMWEAVIADVGVALLAVLNSLRAMK